MRFQNTGFNMNWKIITAIFAATFTLNNAANAQETREQAVVYGEDDRVDVYDHPDPVWRERAHAHVALFNQSSLSVDASGQVSYLGGTLQESIGLCSDELFASQPSSAFCSGTLIAPDLVMTAGHCMEACAGTRIVQGYYYDSANSLHPATQEDIYSCRQVLVQSDEPDYAIFQLDRPVQNLVAPTVNTAHQAVTTNMPLVMIGSPSGIPLKIEDGGTVREPNASSLDHFVATTDSFGGNSGSGVYDKNSGQIVGILVSGEEDYENNGSCVRVNYCGSTTCRGEDITYAFLAVDALCNTITNQTLCNTASSCGDGFCATDENFQTCPTDCSPPVCGDELCGEGEYQSCPDDCVFQIPSTWNCEDEYYGGMDECDCECGAYDPDCDNENAEVFGCGLFGFCNSDGTCSDDGEGCAVSSSISHKKRSIQLFFGLFALLGGLFTFRHKIRSAKQK